MIHLWTADLERILFPLETAMCWLSVEERARARQFLFPLHQKRYILQRALLRYVLAFYTQRLPHTLSFRLNAHGKPFLEENIHFSLSHSQTKWLLVVSAKTALGVDIERVKTARVSLDLASKIFHAAEMEIFRRLSFELQVQSFYNAWTRKEAVLKGLGVGLGYGLKKVRVSWHPDEPARVQAIEGAYHSLTQWQLVDLCAVMQFQPFYKAALVYEGEKQAMQFFPLSTVGQPLFSSMR